MNIMIINGPNLDQLGARDQSVYGGLKLNEIEGKLRDVFPDVNFLFLQSNLEGDIINWIHRANSEFDALLINPAGYTHTSVAIRDALELCRILKIEIHLSNLANREDFRQNLITTSVCDGYISGFKDFSYQAGVYLALRIFNKEKD